MAIAMVKAEFRAKSYSDRVKDKARTYRASYPLDWVFEQVARRRIASA